MRRLTANDWRIVNAALALLEADAEDTAEIAGVRAARVERAIGQVRAKVFDRLGESTEPDW